MFIVSMFLVSCICSATSLLAADAAKENSSLPSVAVLETILELNIGQTQTVTLTDGSRVTVKLVSIKEIVDPAVKALRQARVALEINGKPLELVSGTYRRPIVFDNVQIDVPIVMNYVPRNGRDVWGIAKDARIRLWPKNSPLAVPGTFVYPIRQKHFATSTQMNNEPVFVDGGERPGSKTQYYHSGLDFGGCEGEIEVVAAADSLVISAGLERLSGHEGTPVSPRYDVIYALDGRGWYYRYSHLKRIDVKIGDTIKAGQVIGILGKEAGSGGWAHLHFGVSSNVPNGKWGDLQSYPFVWEAYVNQFKPKVIACARPHVVGVVGQEVELSGELSWAAAGKIAQYEWTFSNGKKAIGTKVKTTYAKPGYYSEILKVIDSQGNADFDTVQVEIFDPDMVNNPPKDRYQFPASIHLTYAPTCNITTGEPVTFKVRSFRTKTGGETIDFGDGTPKVQVKSDGNANTLNPDGYAVCKHVFAKPGTYQVRAEHVNSNGLKATTHVFVTVK